MDFTQISEILGLASSAVGVTSKAVATASDIKALLTQKKPADPAETTKLLNLLAADLTAANMTNVQLSAALKILTTELKEQDAFEKEKSRYKLFKTGQNDMVFVLKDDAAEGQPIHFVCPVCLNRDKIFSFVTGEGDYKYCQTDKLHVFQFSDTPYRSAPDDSEGW